MSCIHKGNFTCLPASRFCPPRWLPQALSVPAPALAQDEPTAATVLAKVGDTEITLGHVLATRSELPAQYNEAPEKTLFDGILEQLIQKTLLMQMVQDNPDLLARLFIDNRTRDILYEQAAREFVEKLQIDDAKLQEEYKKAYADIDPETEYNAAHILVETEDEAREIVEKLAEGEDFTELAKTLSTGPSGPNGGDLGWFADGMMVQPFFDAVVALAPGEVSPPVQTQFGWHVITLKETRAKDIPAFDEVRESLLNDLQQQSFLALLKEREGQTEIDRSGAEGIDPSVINKTDILEN